MGAFLSSPNTSKQSCSGSGTHEDVTYHYGAACMQGWRVDMEDAHSSIPVLDKDTALFAVYDGHGGKEVALYCRENISDRLKKSPAFSEGRIGDALQETFLLLDEEVRGGQAIAEMRDLARREGGSPLGADSSSGDEDYKPTVEEELLLKQEAEIPLEDILAQFGPPNGGSSSRKSMLRALLEEGLDGSSSGSSEGEERSPSESELSEEAPSPASVQSQDEEDPKSPSLPQPSNGMSKKESVDTIRLKKEGGVFSFDASSNIEVPYPPDPQQSLPSPIHSPDKLSHLDTTESAELEEIEAALRGDLEEQDRTPLLPDPVSSDEESGALEAEQSNLPYKLMRKNHTEGFQSGTTAVVCVIYKGDIIVANAGDSRCVLSRQGQAYPLSFDHKPTDAEELKRITRAGGSVNLEGRVNSGLNLSRAIGDHTYKCNGELSMQEQMVIALPDINSTTLQPGDNFLLLACDGIFNVMDNQEAITFVQKRLDRVDLSKEGPSALARICEELCDGCLADNTQNDGSGCDNMTVVIVVPELTNLDLASRRKRKVSGEAENSKRFKPNDLDSCS